MASKTVYYGAHDHPRAVGPYYVQDWEILFDPTVARQGKIVFIRTLASARKAALRIAKMLRQYGFKARVRRANKRLAPPRPRTRRNSSRRRRRTSRR